VVRAGEPERNGLGCLREVRVGRRVRYVEEITAWQRPLAFEYEEFASCRVRARITDSDQNARRSLPDRARASLWRSLSFRAPAGDALPPKAA